jgi:hypothetical protein
MGGTHLLEDVVRWEGGEVHAIGNVLEVVYIDLQEGCLLAVFASKPEAHTRGVQPVRWGGWC